MIKIKWNKELLYAVIFFIAANAIFWYDWLYQASTFILSTPNVYTNHTFMGIFRLFILTVTTINLTNAASLFFLLCAIYAGILALKRASTAGERKMFSFIPKNIPGYLAVALTFISSLFVIMYLIAFCYSIYPTQSRVHYKCPENYTEDDTGTAEYKDALVNWTTAFFKAYPDATMSDWSKAKLQLWLDNNCVVAIQRSKMSGEVVNLKQWELVDLEVQNALGSATNTHY
jgi:hypothetical protein